MSQIGFLGCGKIGKALLEQAKELKESSVVFVQDLLYKEEKLNIIRESDEGLYEKCDLIIECATADVLKHHIELILKHADLLMFSVTAFADSEFEDKVRSLCAKYHRIVYIPHGAILGLDGIFDGNKVWDKVSIETVKNPASLGREDEKRTIVFEGATREGCKLYPRNVNVHAAVALAGIGFDRTRSCIISDPGVYTNSHIIRLEGEGVSMKIQVSSYSTGGVTGKYTPYSACGSLRRILEKKDGLKFV